MVVVGPELLEKNIAGSQILSKAVKILENDDEIQELLRMSNVMAVSRLRYNDHGRIHAIIVSGAALEIADTLFRSGIIPTGIRDKTIQSIDEAKLVILLGAYLHDIGNSIHRSQHELLGALLAKDILTRILPEILGERGRRIIALRQEIMHIIYATEYNTRCLTVEAGIVKIADGTDMSQGRARAPYKLGKVDMHAMSALSINSVEISEGSERPVRITVNMNDYAGLFQIEQILMPKILTSSLENSVEIWIRVGEKVNLYYPHNIFKPTTH
ncbi:HD domain-containing protein [Desulfurococcaceae archaeon AG1]|jgi:metal-dependent HD superfamily phosphatase/phosphodiesterase|nr:MAG: phosphohydrolase [Desulfurococcaceae archaeon]GAY26457.1 HD domain-containing protein [Desulfurococcaceae archaeon AG1]